MALDIIFPYRLRPTGVLDHRVSPPGVLGLPEVLIYRKYCTYREYWAYRKSTYREYWFNRYNKLYVRYQYIRWFCFSRIRGTNIPPANNQSLGNFTVNASNDVFTIPVTGRYHLTYQVNHNNRSTLLELDYY